MSFKKQVKMMGVYLLGWYHAVNTPLPYSQWTPEKKKEEEEEENEKKRKNKSKTKTNIQKLSFKSIFQELGLMLVCLEWLHSRKRR